MERQERLVFGIESSCDDTAAAVLRIGERVEILSSIVRGQDEAHAPFGGVVPEIAARAHADRIDQVAAEALREAGVTAVALDLIAATAGPGLIGGVMAGFTFAKGLSLATGVPLVPVNHLEGHALSAGLEHDVPLPYLLLLVSGGHSQLLLIEGAGKAKRLGTTIDDAAGEAFDKTAKLMGLGVPGGPAIQRVAEEGDAERFAMPRPLLGRKGFDFSFSGLKTAVRQAAEEAAPLSDQDRADLAASFQAAAVKHLASRTEAALRETGATTLVAAGGVAANAMLRARLEEIAEAEGAGFLVPGLKYCTDNAAMIALAGARLHEAGLAPTQEDALALAPRPRWPLDGEAAPVVGKGKRGAKV
ncbi:tRNA (adenosine(37)-N6)-threonylcarbamoyltransferase complex transferase subunit TsaD [Parvularcula sp. ZS-1/3]|uniref:tRNA N6-adenosine threonylcarbamoyltransferase n=1 Tax=Parvularcula mediterranea TaxID=2732508 RepID=A0A7Y3W5A4_9PROT|nr:tRNA (adenosine(37)-N6)-threonylcarbamoyltransferase complex transferase subunit TsaD [Parvularcula mediterranea]NNU16102.1 tRNA (adenosine(37)-N6)-threonylcarbamoyltransferase complex transferase subunit TsaD [Parvularcula mediterranea]